MHEVFDRAYCFGISMMLEYAQPNLDLVAEALGIDIETLDSLSSARISKYIVVLAQYLIMLQYNSNLRSARASLLSKQLEHDANVFKMEGKFPKTATNDKQRRSWLIENNEAFKVNWETYLQVDAEHVLLHGMSSSVDALINALKKELSTRGTSEVVR